MLSNALATLPCLRSLRLKLCGIAHLTSISRLVHQTPTLQTLDLTANYIDDSSVQELSEAIIIQKGDGILTDLILRDNQIGSSGSAALSKTLLRCPNLRKLDVSQNEISATGTASIADCVTTNLTHLSLETCWMGHSGAQAMGRLLSRKTTRLTHLNLGDNAFGDEGVRSLCRGLQQNSTLIALKLHENGIKQDGAATIADVLARHPKLERLDLQRNLIGMDGWRTLAGAVAKNPNIEELLLSNKAFYEPWSSKIVLHLEILRTSRLQRLLIEESNTLWPLVIGSLNRQEFWGFGVLFELLRNKPSILM